MKLLLALSLLGCLPAAAQTTTPVGLEVKTRTAANRQVDSNGIYRYTEIMPHFKEKIADYMASHFHRPAGSRRLSGRIFVKVIVNEDGSLSNVQVARGISKELDEEAVRAVKDMPAWTPGMHDGKVVKVHLGIPVDIDRR
jgi:protein TonB